MMLSTELLNYTDIAVLHSSPHGEILSATHKASGQSVTIRVFQKHGLHSPVHLPPAEIYRILQSIHAPGIPQVSDSIEDNDHAFIVYSVKSGVLLSSRIHTFLLSIFEFLNIAIKLTQTLASLHEQGYIHRDIKPENILLSDDGGVYLLDFSYLQHSAHLWQVTSEPTMIAGTIAYMAPEQTGRMNTGIDYRADLYALGITFYEMLTGQLPFRANEPLEMIYHHLVTKPQPLVEINHAIPTLVQQIVLKLMSKQIEERYQSAYGVLHDLQICESHLQEHGKIDIFPLSQKDIPSTFYLSNKLYGREKEQQIIETAWRQVQGGKANILFVTGEAGIGKSSLIKNLTYKMAAEGGFFCSGKFEFLERGELYHAWRWAIKDICRLILQRSKEEIQKWRSKLLAALGDNGQVIIELVPELQSIIGPQPPVPELAGMANENRFRKLMGNLFEVMCTPEHPLIIFLDDLQWIDLSSLQLLQQAVLALKSSSFMIFGAYRDNEVDALHPLRKWIGEMQNGEIAFSSIHLTAMDLDSVTQFVADSLYCSSNEASPLATLCYSRTNGNPFYLRQLLDSLYQEKLITFSHTFGRWMWSLEKITKVPSTKNVVDLLIFRLQTIDQQQQGIIQYAATIGNTFTIHLLQCATQLPLEVLSGILNHLITQGFLSQIDEDYYFLHDKIQQAAYQMTTPEHIPNIHLEIARAIHSQIPESQLDTYLFDITSQLTTC